VRDLRGEVDPYGNTLDLTEIAHADELAAAADLVKGKLAQVPVAVIRGFLPGAPGPDGPGAVALVRDSSMDMFALGTAEARSAGMADAARLPNYHPFAIGQERGNVSIAGTPPGPELLAEALGGVPLSSTTTLRLIVT